MDDERLDNVITYLEMINRNLTQISAVSEKGESIKELVAETKKLVTKSLEHLHGEEIKKEIESFSSLE